MEKEKEREMSQAFPSYCIWRYNTSCEPRTHDSSYASASFGHRANFQSTVWGSYRERERTLIMRPLALMDPSASRPLADFHSTIWGHHFLNFRLQEIGTQEKLELEALKKIVRKMLVETPDNSTQKLVLIDTIQRLGIAYHFDNEIETSIQNIFDASENNVDDNLNIVALRFRLVRQQGHYMSSASNF